VHQRTIDGYISLTLLDLRKLLSFQQSVILTEIRVTRQEYSWRVMVKGIRMNIPVVAYVYALAYEDAIELAIYMADCGILSFKPDSYPVRVKKEKPNNDEP